MSCACTLANLSNRKSLIRHYIKNGAVALALEPLLTTLLPVVFCHRIYYTCTQQAPWSSEMFTAARASCAAAARAHAESLRVAALYASGKDRFRDIEASRYILLHTTYISLYSYQCS
jgi:hypothetical protein